MIAAAMGHANVARTIPPNTIRKAMLEYGGLPTLLAKNPNPRM